MLKNVSVIIILKLYIYFVYEKKFYVPVFSLFYKFRYLHFINTNSLYLLVIVNIYYVQGFPK